MSEVVALLAAGQAVPSADARAPRCRPLAGSRERARLYLARWGRGPPQAAAFPVRPEATAPAGIRRQLGHCWPLFAIVGPWGPCVFSRPLSAQLGPTWSLLLSRCIVL